MKYKILIVEDEEEIISLIVNRLEKEKYDITVAMNGADALNYIENEYFDLITLDIMLPNVDGMVLCEKTRNLYDDTLIVIISALDLDESRVNAYVLGADDYIAKPFSAKLVALKIDTLLQRRFEMTKRDYLAKKTIQFDKGAKQFYIQNKLLELTPSELAIFETLYEYSNRVFSKEELSQILYDNDIGNITKEGIGTHIYTLRKKIAEQTELELVKTVRSIGYKLNET